MSRKAYTDRLCIVISFLMVAAVLILMFTPILKAEASETVLGYEDRLFDTETLHTIDIVMDDSDDFLENCEDEEYRAAKVVIDGENAGTVGIRAKGNTSLSNVKNYDNDRYSFKIEFDHYDNSNTYYGLDKLNLNNLIQDNTLMKDYLVYTMMNDQGAYAPLVSYAKVSFNGTYFGLYLAVEGVEDSFLTRNDLDGSSLYKPDSQSMNGMGGDQGGGGMGDQPQMDGQQFGPGGSGDQPSFDAGNSGMSDGKDSESSKSSSENERPTFQSSDNSAADNSSNQNSFGPGNSAAQPSQQFDPNNSDASVESSSGTSDVKSSESDSGRNQSGFDSSGMNGNFDGGNGPGQQGGGGGMGSDDVKLKYIDDSISSYSNIFDNIVVGGSTSDQKVLIESLKSLSEREDLSDVLNEEELINYFAVHLFSCNDDSYTGQMIHNYYLSEDNGQLSMIAWDYNLAFGAFGGSDADSIVNASISSPISGSDISDRPMLAWIYEDSASKDQLYSAMDDLSERILSGEYDTLIDQTYNLIYDAVEEDPTKFCTTEEFETGVKTLKEFLKLRAESVTSQVNGSTETIDASSINLSDMGSMNGSGNSKQSAKNTK